MRRGERAAGALPHARPRPRPWSRARLRAPLAAVVLLAPALLGAAGASGETVSLSGNGPGERLDVTLSRVVDPAAPAAPAGPVAPDAADRLVSVEFRLENTGTAAYKDSPAPAAHLLDAYGRRYTGANTSTEAGAAFPDTVTLDPGGSALGFVTFRLPKDAPLAAVQFALNGGLSDDVGHWSLS